MMSADNGVLVLRPEHAAGMSDERAEYSANVARLRDPGLFQNLLSQARYTDRNALRSHSQSSGTVLHPNTSAIQRSSSSQHRRTPSDESWTADSTRWVTHNGPASFAQHDGELYDICLLTGELQPRCGPSFADEHGHVQLPQDREAPHLQHKHKFQEHTRGSVQTSTGKRRRASSSDSWAHDRYTPKGLNREDDGLAVVRVTADGCFMDFTEQAEARQAELDTAWPGSGKSSQSGSASHDQAENIQRATARIESKMRDLIDNMATATSVGDFMRGLDQIERDELLDNVDDDYDDKVEDRRRSWSTWTSFREMVLTSLFGQRNKYENVPTK